MNKKYIASIILVLIVCFFAFKSIDMQVLIGLYKRLSWLSIGLFFLISAAISITKIARFQFLLRNTDINIPLYRTIRLYLASQALTPLPAGEIGRAVLVSKESKENMHKSAVPVITQAFYELFTPALFLLAGSYYYKDFRIKAFLCMLLLVLLLYLFLNKHFVCNFFDSKFARRFKYISKAKVKICEIQMDMRTNILSDKTGMPNMVFCKAFLLSVISNIFGGLLLWAICTKLSVDISIMQCFFIYGAGMVLQTLFFFMPGGIGVTETGMAGILIIQGIGYSKALAIVLLFRFFTLFLSTFIGLFFLIYSYGKRSKS